MTTPEVWTSAEVAAHCEIDIDYVRKRMSRLGVEPVDRETGRTGRHRYLADQVRAAVAAAPGKGRRDMAPPKLPTPDGLVEDYKAGRSTSDLAARYDISVKAVRRMLDDAGVERRTRSEAMKLHHQASNEPADTTPETQAPRA